MYPRRYGPLTLARRLLGRLLGRCLLGGRFLAAAVAVALVVLASADGIEARLQRGHEVGHRLLGLLGRRLHGDGLALRLAFVERKALLAIRVAVVLGVERPGERVDELGGDLEL